MPKYRIYIFGSKRHNNLFEKVINRSKLEIIHIDEEKKPGKSKGKKEIVKEFELKYNKIFKTKGIIIFGRSTVKNGIKNIAGAVEILKRKYPELKETQIIGPSLQGARIFNNKDLTQKYLSKENIATPKTYRQLHQNKIKFPVVLKPLELSGGSGMEFVKNGKELENYILKLNKGGIKKLIATEFLKGIEITYTVLRLGNNFLRLPVSYKRETDKKLTHPDSKVKLSGFCNGYNVNYSRIEKLMKKYKIYGLFSLQGVMVKSSKLSKKYDTYFLEAATRITGSTVIMSAALKDFNLYKTIADWIIERKINFSYQKSQAIQYSSYKHNGKKTIEELKKLKWVLETKYEDLSKMPYHRENKDRIRISFSVENNIQKRIEKISNILNSPEYKKEILDAISFFKKEKVPIENKKYLSGKWTKHINWEFYLSNYLPSKKLCTAVFGILEYKNKIILTKTKRGWELPGGHIEKEETIEEALKREILEETGAHVDGYQLIGYRKIIASKRIRNKNGRKYPFPVSYIPYYKIFTEHKIDNPKGNKSEVLDTKGYTFQEIKKLKINATAIIELIRKVS